jgi:elongation factor Ts
VRREEVPTDVLENEKKIARAQLIEQGKPEAMLEKILPGKLEKYFKEVCLMEQIFFKDPDGKRTVQQELTDVIAKIGENMTVRRFVRMALGEGLKKETKDFAAEVSAAVGAQAKA